MPTAPAQANDDVKVQAAHLLVKHKDSRRPSSWREANITRTKDEARKILEGYLNQVVSYPSRHHRHVNKQNFVFFLQIKSGEATLDQLATEYSDCSSAKRGGDLGPFGRGTMQKPFEEATFRLKVGELSDIIETDSGLHIIERLKWMSVHSKSPH